jgi:uncharacterized membrane protein required for colicin V production
MKPFQSRVVAAWIVALPVAYAYLASSRHRIERLRIDAQAEIAQQLRLAQNASFVTYFIGVFAMLVVLTVVIDALAKGIQRFFPEGQTSVISSDQSRPLG